MKEGDIYASYDVEMRSVGSLEQYYREIWESSILEHSQNWQLYDSMRTSRPRKNNMPPWLCVFLRRKFLRAESKILRYLLGYA